MWIKIGKRVKEGYNLVSERPITTKLNYERGHTIIGVYAQGRNRKQLCSIKKFKKALLNTIGTPL